jgi:hypothetical protein
MQVLAQEKRRKHTSVIQAIQAHPMVGCHASIPWIYDVINPWEEDPL